jgi:hypothetical protein
MFCELSAYFFISETNYLFLTLEFVELLADLTIYSVVELYLVTELSFFLL